MIFENLKALAIPQGDVLAITAGGSVLWEKPPSYVNLVPLSVDTDGSIYNGTGYRNGYRVRSGGAEAAMTNAACTGYIPVNGGDVIRVYGWARYAHPENAANAINVADASFANLGQIGNGNYGIFTSGGGYAAYDADTIEDGSDGISKWTVPPSASGVAYIRVSGWNASAPPGAALIVTRNEEIVLE